MSVGASILVAVVAALILGVVGWLARPIFRRPQQVLAGAFAGPPIACEVQIHVDCMSDVPVLDGPTSYTFTTIDPRQVAPGDLPYGVTEWQNWAYKHGGEDVETSIVQVTLQGMSSDPISIEAPVLDHHKVLPRRRSDEFGPAGLGGGGVMPRNYTFEISGEDVIRHFDEDQGRPEAFQLAEGDTERLIIRIRVSDSFRHEWAIRIPYVRTGKRAHLEVRHPAGLTFVTNGGHGLTRWYHGDRWFKQ